MTPPLAVSAVDFATIFVDDLPAAKEFYGSVLELPLTVEYGKNGMGAEFETSNLTLQLMSSEAIGREFTPSGHPLALRVDDVAAARSELESRGVVFHDTIDSGVCHMAFFSDPSGNALMLHNRYAPRSS